MGGACSMHGRDEKAWCRWEDIRMNIRETRWEGVDWIHLAQDRDQCWALMIMVVNLWVL
jgi:hypothetical protein